MNPILKPSHAPSQEVRCGMATNTSSCSGTSSTAAAAAAAAAPAAARPLYEIHILIYGRNLHEERFRRLATSPPPPSTVLIVRYDPASTVGSTNASSATRTSQRVLVVDGKFLRGTTAGSGCTTTSIDALPNYVGSAVAAILRGGGRVCTDGWLGRFKANGWTEQSRGEGLASTSSSTGEGEFTDSYRRALGLAADHCSSSSTCSSKEAGGCAGRPTASASGGRDDVIDLLSDAGDGEDEKKADSGESEDDIEVITVKPAPKRLKAETFVKADNNAKSKKVQTEHEQREQIKAERRRCRNVSQRREFSATWLRGVDGVKEAKVKATLLHKTYPRGQSPEEVVLARANAYMNKVKDTSKRRWNFVFEECHNEQCRAEREKSRAVSSAHSTSASATSADDAEEPSLFQETRERNHAIGRRMRDIFNAEVAMDEFERIRFGRRLDKTEGARRDFREMQYKRVARTVETYPIKVTLDCLLFPPPWVDARYRGSLCEKLGVPRIKCNEGSSTRARLIRAILFLDNPHDYRLALDLDNEKTSHRRDESLLRDPDYKAINELRQIWGVGLATASRFCLWGIDSIHDLRNDTEVYDTLNYQQKVGLKRYEDLIERIPRQEVKELADSVTEVVTRLSNGKVTVTVGGSYRRGAPSSGDVDMILLPAEGEDDKAAVDVMEIVLNELRRTGFLTDDLAVPNQFGENDGKNPGTDSRSYMGVCRLQDRPDRRYRRIDIKAYPACQGPFALIYFTGDTHFNRSLRYFAKKASLTLSDAGLSACVRRKTPQGWKRVHADSSVRCRTEEDVFRALGIKNVDPTFRACHNLDKMRIRGKRWDESQISPGEDESDYEDSSDEEETCFG
mmetsp:Transcript_7536/g.16488  ORF Transcript_7536/g.16488 Transcript_7536/m.16488 type:complete len:851 (+) Transcript_7536:142-2694(+)